MKWLILGILTLSIHPSLVFADCVSPAGTLGAIQYHGGYLQFCQGKNWQAITGTTGSACTPAGLFLASGDDFKACNGGVSHTVSGLTETSDTCSVVGTLQFNSDLLSTGLKSSVASPMKWKSVAGGYSHTCGIREGDERLFCWGSEGSGVLGNGKISISRTWPVQLTSTVSDLTIPWSDVRWKMVSLGSFHTCGIRSDDKLFCWGSGGSYRLGYGGNTEVSEPTEVYLGKYWKSVAAGSAHTCAIDSSDRLYCWGSNSNGQIGDGTNTEAQTPKQIGSGKTWFKVSVGYLHTCAIDTSQKLFCWGENGLGALGDTTTTDSKTPVAVNGSQYPNANWVQVSLGNDHTCGLKSDNTLYCWGLNKKTTETNIGRLGVQSPFQSIQTPTLLNGNWSFIAARNDHACAVNTTGQVYCWGDNYSGQLGTGNGSPHLDAPTTIAMQNVSQMASGYYHACALNTAGEMSCWGGGASGAYNKGQLGNGSTIQSNVPVDLIGGKMRFCRSNGKWYQGGP